MTSSATPEFVESIIVISCRYNHKPEKDGMCRGAECILKDEVADKRGCVLYKNHPKVLEIND